MRLATIQTSAGPRAALLHDKTYYDLHATNPQLPASLRAILEGGPSLLQAVAVVPHTPTAARYPEGGVKLLPPIPDPQKIICVGLNYRDHAAESGAPIPKEPVLFSKFTTALVGDGDAIVLPPVSQEVDYEAELVLVVGKKGRHLTPENAMEHLAGYTIGHDVSASGGRRICSLTADSSRLIQPEDSPTIAPYRTR